MSDGSGSSGDPAFRQAVAVDAGVLVDLLRGKMGEIYGPLASKLLNRAYEPDIAAAAVAAESLAAE